MKLKHDRIMVAVLDALHVLQRCSTRPRSDASVMPKACHLPASYPGQPESSLARVQGRLGSGRKRKRIYIGRS